MAWGKPITASYDVLHSGNCGVVSRSANDRHSFLVRISQVTLAQGNH